MGQLSHSEIDARRQEEAREYARIRHRLLAVDLALGAFVLLVMLLGGISLWLKGQVLEITSNPPAAVALYFLAFALGYGLLIFPLSYYSGFILPHRYGLSTQTLGDWLKDQAKGAVLGLVLGGAMVEVMYALLRTFPDTWWLWTAGFLLLFTILLSNLAPILIIPLFFKQRPLEDADLVERLTDLSRRAGARVRGVFTIDLSSKTTAANAAVVGLGNTRRIILGDTLYADYSHDEIATILAHELGHHAHGDLGKGIAVQTALTLIGLYLAHVVLHWSVRTLGFASAADIAAFPLLGLAMGGYMVITTPLSNAYSRWRESLADDYALRLTGDAEAFISAMVKLANQNLAEVDPERWVELLLYTHPPVGKRIARAQDSQ